MLPINYVAVLIAAVIAFIIGFLMHGPVAGKLWMRLAKVTPTGNEKLSDMYGQMFWNLVVNIVTAYALAVLIMLASTSSYMSTSALENGLIIALPASPLAKPINRDANNIRCAPFVNDSCSIFPMDAK